MSNKLSLQTGVHVDWVQFIYFDSLFEPTHEKDLVDFGVEDSMGDAHALQVDFSDYLPVVVVVEDYCSL